MIPFYPMGSRDVDSPFNLIPSGRLNISFEKILRTSYNEQERIWSGQARTPIYDFNCSIGYIIHKALRSYPQNICQINLPDGKVTKNQELLDWSVQLAQVFKQRGLRHDNVIGIIAQNSTYVTPVAVACLFNGTPFHAVNPTLDVDTLRHIFGITRPSIIFCDSLNVEKLKTACAAWEPELITLTGNVQGVACVKELLLPTKTNQLYQPEPLILGGDQTMAILCSSGTTGKPKAVCLANHTLVNNESHYPNETVLYSVSTMDWFSGLSAFLLSVVDRCTRILTEKPYSPEFFLELVEKYKVNAAILAPRHVTSLVACPQATPERLVGMNAIGIGGGWIASETLMRLNKLLKNVRLVFGYGTTETGYISKGIYSQELGNTVGSLVNGVRVRIVDEKGENLGPEERGEVYVNHGLSWNGYYGNQLESQQLRDSLGWFHTGDLGYFDAQGNLYIVDRKKDILKYQGMQYFPNDIEVAIAELPDVREVCVVGIYDEKYGDVPTAMVVKQSGSDLSAEQIREHVAKRMVVEFKKLHGGVYFVDALPQTPNGKVSRQAVKEQLRLKLDR